MELIIRELQNICLCRKKKCDMTVWGKLEWSDNIISGTFEDENKSLRCFSLFVTWKSFLERWGITKKYKLFKKRNKTPLLEGWQKIKETCIRTNDFNRFLHGKRRKVDCFYSKDLRGEKNKILKQVKLEFSAWSENIVMKHLCVGFLKKYWFVCLPLYLKSYASLVCVNSSSFSGLYYSERKETREDFSSVSWMFWRALKTAVSVLFNL